MDCGWSAWNDFFAAYGFCIACAGGPHRSASIISGSLVISSNVKTGR